jgi:hypothetical protein
MKFNFQLIQILKKKSIKKKLKKPESTDLTRKPITRVMRL